METAKLGRKLSTAEVKVLKQKKTKIIMTRMNPEWHKPDHDNPEGRSKMRWLVLGYMQDGDGENKDAPTLLDSTVKMPVAMGTEKGETKDDVISTGDIAVAFLQGYNFDSTLGYPGEGPCQSKFQSAATISTADLSAWNDISEIINDKITLNKQTGEWRRLLAMGDDEEEEAMMIAVFCDVCPNGGCCVGKCRGARGWHSSRPNTQRA